MVYFLNVQDVQEAGTSEIQEVVENALDTNATLQTPMDNSKIEPKSESKSGAMSRSGRVIKRTK